MKKLVAQSMEEGAWGISTGLTFIPSCFADTNEVVELAKVAAGYGGSYFTHVRMFPDGSQQLWAVDEGVQVARRADMLVQVAHLGSSTASYNYAYKRSCTLDAIDLLDRAAREGVKVQWDVYPYNFSALNRLRSWLSPELANMDKKTGLAKLASAEFRDWLRGEMVGPAEGWYVGKLDWILACHVASCTTKPELVGRRLWDLAEETGKTKDPLDFLCDLVLETDDQALCTIMNIKEPDLQAILRHPLGGPSSDGSALDHPLAPPRVAHPRHAGSFVRFLGRYCREQKLFPLEEAVRKMTSLPAQSVGLKDRGTLMVGNWADVVVFDPDTVADRATFEDPYQRPVGIDYVLVNGVVTVESGKLTNALAGRALRHGQA